MSKQAALIRTIEELSMNAQPSFYTLMYDGWLLRFANGYTRRANSVNPLYPSNLPLEDKIAYCQDLYHARELPLIFKVTDIAQPPELDEALANMGMRRNAMVSVQVLDLRRIDKTPTLTDVWVDTSFRGQWLLSYAQMNTLEEEHVPNAALMLASILPPTCFLSLRVGQEVVAVGMGVYERGWLGIFDVVVAPHMRGQGIGRQLMLNLLAWGKRQGASYSYLQSQTSNAPALGLYHALGYREAYRYWYRELPVYNT
ncbi:MAG: GNAT family N-acetyltransferase [Chloroflexota bacterium]|nr:GNAT family N-acetyltransferase [Chloroflexota bacterium]